MNVLTFSEARAGFKQALDDVCQEHTPTLITRQRGEHVVMLSLGDYSAILETLHLLRSPSNAERLMASIAQFKAGKARTRTFSGNDKQKNNKQKDGEPSAASVD